jgi:lipopolysaccharide export system permease protein
MSIFSRYVFRQAAGALVLILSSLAGIVWIALALRQLNVVTSQGQDAWALFQMTTLALPNLMALIAPFALLIAVMHTLNRLNGDSELIVYAAAGATVWTVARPLLLLGLIVSAAVSFVNHYGMPWSMRELREYVVAMRTDLLSQVIQPGRFSSPEQGLTFHIRERAPNGELIGLIMHDTRKQKEQTSYLAERGIIVKQDPTAYLVMIDGHIVRQDKPKEPAQIIVFDRYAVDLNEFEQQTTDDLDLKPRERYYSELMNPEASSVSYKRSPGQFTAELHERFANPLYPIAFVLIAVAAAGQARSTRQNRVNGLIAGFTIATGSRLAGLALNNVVVLKPHLVALLYAIPILGIIGASLAIMTSGRQRRGPTWAERFMERAEPALEAIRGMFVRGPRPKPARG